MIIRQHLLGAVADVLQKVPDMVAVAALSGGASELIKELRRQWVAGRIIGSRLLADPQEVELFGEERNGTMVVAGFWRGRTERSGDFNAKFLAEVEARGIHTLGAHHTDAWARDGV